MHSDPGRSKSTLYRDALYLLSHWDSWLYGTWLSPAFNNIMSELRLNFKNSTQHFRNLQTTLNTHIAIFIIIVYINSLTPTCNPVSIIPLFASTRKRPCCVTTCSIRMTVVGICRTFISICVFSKTNVVSQTILSITAFHDVMQLWLSDWNITDRMLDYYFSIIKGLWIDSPTQVAPSPMYPSLQAYVNEPAVLVHVASVWQLWVSTVHSSMSLKYAWKVKTKVKSVSIYIVKTITNYFEENVDFWTRDTANSCSSPAVMLEKLSSPEVMVNFTV